MRIPMGPALGIVLAAAILIATAFDLAVAAGHALAPWLGWMLP
jgi:hypothetical protein